MRLKLQPATAANAPAIVSLRIAIAEKLTATYGIGPWSGATTEKMVLFNMRRSSVYIARQRGKLIAILALGTKKPWAIDRKYFSKCGRPLYLTDMAVAPELQRQGIGRLPRRKSQKIGPLTPSSWTLTMLKPGRESSIANAGSVKWVAPPIAACH